MRIYYFYQKGTLGDLKCLMGVLERPYGPTKSRVTAYGWLSDLSGMANPAVPRCRIQTASDLSITGFVRLNLLLI